MKIAQVNKLTHELLLYNLFQSPQNPYFESFYGFSTGWIQYKISFANQNNCNNKFYVNFFNCKCTTTTTNMNKKMSIPKAVLLKTDSLCKSVPNVISKTWIDVTQNMNAIKIIRSLVANITLNLILYLILT